MVYQFGYPTRITSGGGGRNSYLVIIVPVEIHKIAILSFEL